MPPIIFISFHLISTIHFHDLLCYKLGTTILFNTSILIFSREGVYFGADHG